MQIFLASSAIKASCERLEGTTEAFDVTPTGMTQITYIPRVKDVSSLKPEGAKCEGCIQFKALGRFAPSGALNWIYPSHS